MRAEVARVRFEAAGAETIRECGMLKPTISVLVLRHVANCLDLRRV